MLSRQLSVSKALLVSVLFVAVQCLFPPAAWSRELKMSIEPSFTSGKYGTDSTTDTFEVPLKLRYTDGPYKVGLRIPYLSVTGPQSPVPGIGLVGSETGARGTVRGLGDVGLRGAVRVLGGRDGDWLELEAGLALRLPTGNQARGLGSGQLGVSPHLDTTIDLGTNLSLDVTVGRFIRTRHPQDQQLRDYFYATVELDYDIVPQVTVGVIVDAQQASVSYGTGVLEAGVFAEYEFTSGTRIGVSMSRGFTRDSSAFSVGLLLSHRFSW